METSSGLLRHVGGYVRSYRAHRDLARLRRTKLEPFDNREAIFVHIPKTGGVSISMALFGELVGHHRTIHQYAKIFGDEVLRSYFKFTFVRNPWDRFVSAYFYLLSGGMHETDASWADENLVPYGSFRDFVTGWVSPENVRSWRHFIPQVDFVCDCDTNILVDHVGHFESIEKDFQAISARLGIETALDHINRSERRDYRSYYDDQTREIIADVYRYDAETFGYKFE